MKQYQILYNKTCPDCGSAMLKVHGQWMCNCMFDGIMLIKNKSNYYE